MNEDFRQYVYRRCEKALIEDNEYMQLEQKAEDQDAIQARAEELCYMRGWADAMALLQCR